MFKLSIDNYLTTKVIATEDGKKIKVRQLGAGEALDISSLGRQVAKLAQESEKIQRKIGGNIDPNSEEFKEFIALTDKIGKINEQIEAVYIKAFDDGTEDKAIAKQIVHTLGAQKMPQLMKDIFADA
jgi:hypothetical protein